MSKFKEHYRVLQYRPQAAKSLRSTLHSFIRREFPRLGGSWVVCTPLAALESAQGQASSSATTGRDCSGQGSGLISILSTLGRS